MLYHPTPLWQIPKTLIHNKISASCALSDSRRRILAVGFSLSVAQGYAIMHHNQTDIYPTNRQLKS
jgi:hypothetical protein